MAVMYFVICVLNYLHIIKKVFNFFFFFFKFCCAVIFLFSNKPQCTPSSHQHTRFNFKKQPQWALLPLSHEYEKHCIIFEQIKQHVKLYSKKLNNTFQSQMPSVLFLTRTLSPTYSVRFFVKN